MAKTWLKRAAWTLAALLIAIQLVPYGRDHNNPRVVEEPKWASPEARALAQRACFDCHSNETRWPWYASIAPFSWLLQNHVDEGREELNFSEWHKPQKEAHEAAELLLEGEMPLVDYTLLHPEARLNEADKKTLADAFVAMFGRDEEEHDEESTK